MRTTLDVDQDVLLAAKEIGAIQGKSAGKVLSELARRALQRRAGTIGRNGVRVIPKVKGGTPVTMELVNRLRDELP